MTTLLFAVSFAFGALVGCASTLALWWRHERNLRGEL